MRSAESPALEAAMLLLWNVLNADNSGSAFPSHVVLRAVLNLAGVPQAAVLAKAEPFESEIILIIHRACAVSRVSVFIVVF